MNVWIKQIIIKTYPEHYADLALKCDSFLLQVIIMNLTVCELDIRSIYPDDGAFVHLDTIN